jgi:hypothetical protein
MCKRHWKEVNCLLDNDRSKNNDGHKRLDPEGESVYETILPMSIQYRPSINIHYSALLMPGRSKSNNNNNTENPKSEIESVDDLVDIPIPHGVTVMPLIKYFKDHADQPPGWHRNNERRARGLHPVPSIATQLEPWERQLALFEILLLSGGTPYANFKDLAHAWGREKGFHCVLSNSVCERRGEFDRKRRSDAGRAFTDDEKEMLRTKLKKGRLADVIRTNHNNNNTAVSEEENTAAIFTADEHLGDGKSNGPEPVQV